MYFKISTDSMITKSNRGINNFNTLAPFGGYPITINL